MQPLIRLLDLPNLTDLLINGTEVFADCGTGLQQQQTFLTSGVQTAQLAKQLIELGGGHLDYANPMADVVLYRSEIALPASVVSMRVHCVLDALVATTTLISIRLHRAELHEFDSNGFEAEIEQLKLGEASFAISGATGSGKTSLLRTLLSQRPELRTALLEDSQELRGLKGHVLELSARSANTEGFGAIGLQSMLNQSLRMRPDRIVVGEVRGPEIVTLLQALNLGVKQVACTIHANSASLVRSRMLALWLQATSSTMGFEELMDNHEIWVVHLVNHRIAEVGRL